MTAIKSDKHTHDYELSLYCVCVRASLLAQMVKNLPAMQETQVQSLGQEIPWRREWLPTPAFLPGESHGQRSLADNSPWAHTELGMTEGLSMHTQPPI